MKTSADKKKHPNDEQHKCQLINTLTDIECLNTDTLLAFGYFLSNQTEHLYNLSYYTSQFEEFDKSLKILNRKRMLYESTFQLATRFAKQFFSMNITIKIFIDEIYAMTNATNKEYSLKQNIATFEAWSLGIDHRLAENFNIKKGSTKNIAIRIVCEKRDVPDIVISERRAIFALKKSDNNIFTHNEKILDAKLATNICKYTIKYINEVFSPKTKNNEE